VGTVLGLSLTPSGVGWVVLDGSSADSEVLDHDVCDVGCGSLTKYLETVRGVRTIAAAGGQDLATVGVTWTDDAAEAASLVLKALPDLGFDKVVSVPLAATDASNEALQALARGAALGVYSNAETVPIRLPVTVPSRPQSKWRTPARAAVAVAAGAAVLFVVGPDLAGQLPSRPSETQPDAASLGFHAVTAPAAEPSAPDVVHLVAGHPKPAPTRKSPVIAAPVQQTPVVPLSTESALQVAPEHAASPSLPGPASLPATVANPAPLPAAQPAALPTTPVVDPAQAVVNPLFSALP
jgi:hypothetical protein